MGCINKNLKDNQRLIQDFSETRVNQLFDEYFPNENPSYGEFISNPNVKEALGIIPISKVKSEIGKAFGKEISSRELKILKKSISDINDKLLGHSYKLFNIKQKGESDNYSWGLRKINSNINIQAKIDRLKQRINTGKQIRNLEDNQFNFPDINQTIKPGVEELFESNPEFSSQIYEALGFDNKLNIPDYIITTRPYSDENIGSKGRTGNMIEFTSSDNIDEYRQNMGGYLIQTNDEGRLYITDIEKYSEDSTFKGLGTVAYVDFYENYKHKSQGITTDKSLTSDGIRVLERLEKMGLVYKTDAVLIDNTQKHRRLNTTLYRYNKPLYEFNLNWSRTQITPQQKQQAQLVYSQYLNTTNNPTIQGFKDFIQGKQFQKLTAEEKAKTIEQVTKEQNNSLFGLNTQNQEQLEFHVNTLNVVSKFLENVGVEQRLIPEFLSQDGSVVEGAIAAANFIEGTVDIIDDLEKGRIEAWNKLPEEAAHWWYRLLDKNSELKDALLTSALTDRKEEELRNSLYGKTYNGVKVVGKLALDSNGNVTSKPALSAIREEAIGQLIAEAIKRIETQNGSAADYSFFKKFLEWINSIIDIFKNTKQDPFEVAAMKILSSDMSDLMTWEEYRKLNNIVNFADVLTEQSVAPLDYTLLEDIGRPSTQYSTGKYTLFNKYGTPIKDVPLFDTREELDNWVYKKYGKEYNQKQKQILQEVRDNQIFFDRLLNKTFRKKSKFLPKTLRKYFDIIDAQNLNQLREWNISQELQQITKKLSEQEKKQIIETNGYTNIAPTLKVLPDLLQKYRKNPIVLSETIKVDGAKKQELSILNGIKEMIKLENPNLKSITAEEFVNEAHNWLETNYLLGFANEKSYLSYRTDQTFSYLSDRQSNEDVDITNMTEEELQRLPFEERQRIANIVGLTKQNPDVYHNKVSLRFNDMYHLKSGHFDKSPSAWGNLTYFYTGKNKWKDAVLLHEIQNDNIEFLREFKAEKVDLETSLGRYLQQLNTDLIDNITQIESNGKKISRKIVDNNAFPTHRELTALLYYNKDLPLEQGLQQLKQNLNERIELYKSYSSKNLEKAQEAVDKAYSQRRIFQDFQRKGGIKSLLTKEELNNLKEILNRLNTEEVMTDAVYMPEENQFEPGYPAIRNLGEKKHEFKIQTIELQARITGELQKMYGDNAPLINLTAPAKPLPKSQRNMRIVGNGQNQRRIGGASQELNENVNWLLAYSEKKISNELSKTIEESKKNYISARNATVANNFNVQLSKITLEQWTALVENYKYNQDLLNRLVDEQAQKDIQKESNIQDKITEAYQSIENRDYYYEYFLDGKRFEVDTREEAEEDIEDYYNPEVKKRKQKKEFETLKQQALDKKAELEKNYGKIEEEVKQTLEIEMNYFTPLVHHLIQKHINQYGKDFPMYFSGYQITKLTQGNDRTAWIYAGKDEIDLIPHSDVNINGKNYRHDGDMKYVPLAFYIDNKQYRNINGEFSTREDGLIENITEQEYNKAKQEYEKAYQQATERRAKEIKYQAAQQIGLINSQEQIDTLKEELRKEKVQLSLEGKDFAEGYFNMNMFNNSTSEEQIEKIKKGKEDLKKRIKELEEKINNPIVDLEEGIKKLNEYKKQSKQNLDRVINTIMNISNDKPIETGAIYNAMSQISGVKLIWQDKIEGLKGDTGGYLVDLTNYNYNTPILYGLNTSKVVPINPNMVDNSEIQYSKEFVKNNTKPKVVDIEDIISYEGVKGDYKSEINRRALNEPTDSDVFHYPFSEVYDELDQSEPTGEFEDTFDSEFETNSKKLDKIILNRYLKIQKSLERQKDKLVSEFNKIENTNDFTKDAEIYFDKHKELISEINIVEEKLKRIKAVVDAIFDKKDITSVVIAESNLIIDDINKLLKSENISPAELDYYYNLTKLLEEIHDENLKQEDSSLFTNASSEDLNQLKKLKNTFSNLNNDLLELLRKNINIKNDPIKDAKLFSQWFLKVGDYTNDILKKAESMISKSLFNITKFLNKELEAIKELHLKADSDFKRTGKQNNKFDIFFDKNKRIVQVFNYEYTDAAAKLYNAFRFASKDSAKSKRLELIRFHKQHSILLNAKYLFPDIYEHLTGTKVSAEEINKNIALYKSYLDDYTFEKMKSKVYKQTIKYLSKRDNDFFMSNMPFDENSLIQEFLTYIPKDKSNYNDKYSKIVQNDNLRNVYDKFMDLFNELKLISQGTTRSNLNKGFLPFLEKTMIENLSDFSFSTELGKFKQSILSSYDQLKNNSGQTVSNQVENPLKTVNDGLRSFLETKANDYYKQEKINLIYFLAHKKLTTNSAKLITEKFGPGFPSKKAEEIIESWTKEYFTSLEDTQTNDIQVLMNLMAQTVTSYKQKQAIESNLNLIKIAFDNQAVGEFDILGNLVGTNPTKKGRETKLAELLEVTINHFFGKNVQKPQLNDFLKRINNVSVAKQEELNKLVKEINENKELTPNEKIELEKALQNKFKQDSKYVDLDKINDKLLQYLRVLFLGWSPKSAFFNAAMGHIGNYMETIDGRIVDSKDLSAGVKMLFGKEKKKIQKLIANLSLIEDITKDFKKTTEESLHNEKWKNFKPERLQQIVEKSNQSPLIAALLNKSFNGVRIIDMIDESGNFLPQYEEYEYKFVNTAKYLIEKVHGPYDSNRIIMAETTSLGKNVIFMKKWMITSFFMKRFGSFDEKPREDLLMDYQFKGTYITLADVFNTMSNDQSGQRNYLLGIMKTMKAIALSDQSLTEVDKANLRSVRADLLIIGALLIAQQLVKYMLSDDDDDHEGLVFLLNTFFRIETELGSHYFLIDTFEGLAKNTIPQLDVYNRLEKIIKSFDENARISPAIRLAQMVPALNSGVSLYNFFNQQILYNR